jgi:hypothetical protein
VTNSVSSRKEFNKEIEKNLKVKTKAGHFVQSEGERIIADRLYECGIDYVYDSLIEVNGEWLRPDFLLPKLNNFIIEFKGMDEPEYHENQRFSGCQKSSIFVHNEKFMEKLEVLRNAGMQVMVLREKDLGKIKEVIV